LFIIYNEPMENPPGGNNRFQPEKLSSAQLFAFISFDEIKRIAE